jgi:hypothetical protein
VKTLQGGKTMEKFLVQYHKAHDNVCVQPGQKTVEESGVIVIKEITKVTITESYTIVEGYGELIEK